MPPKCQVIKKVNNIMSCVTLRKKQTLDTDSKNEAAATV